MNTHWIIENIFDWDVNPLIASLNKFGIKYSLIECHAHEYQEKLDFLPFDRTDYVVFMGSLQLGKYLKHWCWKNSVYPGPYWSDDIYECSNYYPLLNDYLLNNDFIILPYWKLLESKEMLYDLFGEDRTIFIRPDSDCKVFTGTPVFKEKYEQTIEYLGYGNVPKNTLCYISSPKNLLKEWRLVVSGYKVITASLYRRNALHVTEQGCPQDLIDFVESNILSRFNPDPIWVLDMCETKSGAYKVIELGPFSCAGLYDCDRDLVVQQVQKLKEIFCEEL